jgi:zinc and cadmium transporter
MPEPWILIALTLVANGAAGLAGGLLSERWLERHQPALVGFAAGALLGAAFLNVLPEALRLFGAQALTWAFGAFLALALLEWKLGHHHRTERGTLAPTLPVTLLSADALHNIGDGAAIAAAFQISPEVGLAVGMAVVVHEVPQEVGDYAVLRASGFSRYRALLALGLAQLTAVLGALGVIFTAERSHAVVPAVLSLASGTFFYIGATDLLPEVHSGRTPGERRQRMVGFVFGVGLMVLTSVLEH